MDGDVDNHRLSDKVIEEDEKIEKAEPDSQSVLAKEDVVKQDIKFVSPTFAVPKRSVSKPKRTVEEKNKKGPESNNSNDLPFSSNATNEKSESASEFSKKEESPTAKPLQTPFKPPAWCCVCNKNYSFEILKSGVMKGEIGLTEKPFYIFGRLDGCDVVMEHPSISRYHAVVVYKGPYEEENMNSKVEEGFYIMDLGSTHGTVVNKIEIKPKVFHRLRVGYVVKFGGSSRLHILQGPQEDQDEETEMEIIKQSKSSKNEEEDEREEGDINDEDEGITWGIAEDAVEEEVDLEKLLASRKPLELKDPKKTLRGFFEREGLDLEYESDERGTGNSRIFVIRVRLPIEDASGEEIFAEGSSTKKKDAVVACAFEACRIIDAHGMLRNAMHESERSKKAKRLAENDFYDSDEDSFLDRTGSVESKRKKRMKKAGKATEEPVETYDSLMESLRRCRREISTIEKSLEDDKRAEELANEEGADDLDDYMMIVAKRLDKKTRVSFKHRLALLRKEERRIKRLVELVKPTELPALSVPKPDELVSTKPESTSGDRRVEQIDIDDKVEHTQDSNSHKLDSNCKELELNRSKNERSKSVADVLSRIDPKEKNPKEHQVENAKRKKPQKKKIYGPQSGPSVESKFTDWLPPEEKYPEIKKLMVVDQAFKYKVVFLVLLQFIAIYLVKDVSWGLTLLLAYTIAGVVNHALLLAIHETAHNAAYGHSKPIQNKLFSIFTNLPIGVPCAISFKKYHLDHHKYMGNEDIDVDLPSDFEAHFFTNQFSKFVWVVCQGVFYSIRPLFVRPLPMQPLEALNVIIQIAFDIFILMVLGPKSLVYMIAGSFMGMGLHPVAGHFISEHYMFKNGYETYSYYGPLNMVTFNVGYHNEHHDFPNIPGSLLPKVREIAPEYYTSLPSHDSWTRVLLEFIRDPAIGPYARIKRKNNLGKNYLSGNLKKNVKVSENDSKVTSNGLKINSHPQLVNGDLMRESAHVEKSTDQAKLVNGHIKLENGCLKEINGKINRVADHVKSD